MLHYEVELCPFCGSRNIKEVGGTENILKDGRVLFNYEFHCDCCDSRFSVNDEFVVYDVGEKRSESKDSCVKKPDSEWYEQRYYETLRELEKTRYLLDLTVKEGMRRE